MASESTRLNVQPREIEGSRANRRLRRTGRVPAVIYGGDSEPTPVSVDARELRHALQASGAVLELELDGSTQNAMLKDAQTDPVRGDVWHLDFLRVRMDVAIQTTVVLELTGVDEAPGIVEGGVLEQQTRELNIEALPGDVPEVIEHDASGMELNGTLHLSEIAAPKGVTFLDDPEETVVASITLPRLEVEDTEVETETAVVGEGEGEAFAPEGSDASDQPETGGAGDGDQPDTTSE
jgi:large subunit ribosomal protein L25